MNRMIRFSKWFGQNEPAWYLGWAGVTLVATVTLGTFWGWPWMYLCLACMANDRNEAERSRDQWYRRTLEWEALSTTWMRLYKAERDKNGR